MSIVCLLAQQPSFATPANFIDLLDSIVKMSKKDLLDKYGDQLQVDEYHVKGLQTWSYRLDESFSNAAVRPKVQITVSDFDNMVYDVSFYWEFPESRVPVRDTPGRLRVGFDRLNNSVANSMSDGIHSIEKKSGWSHFVCLVKGDSDSQRWLRVKAFIRSMNNLNKLQVRSILGDTVNASDNGLEYQITPMTKSSDGKRMEDDCVVVKFLLEAVIRVTVMHEQCAAK